MANAATPGSCGKVEIDLGQAMNQGATPSCYAFTAGLLITSEMRKLGVLGQSQVFAPETLWTEILSKDEEQKNELLSATKGRVCQSAKLAMRLGGCRREVVLDLMKNFLNNDSGKSLKNIDPDGRFANFRNAIRKSTVMEGDQDSMSCNGYNVSVSSVQSFHQLLNIQIQSLLAGNTDIYLHEALKLYCKERGGWVEPMDSVTDCDQYDFIKSGKELRLLEPKAFKSKIHELLDRSTASLQPIGIEYCSGVLGNPSKSHIVKRTFHKDLDYLNTPQAKRNLSSSCGFHASAIIGRERMKDGNCYFIVQNSWGKECNEVSQRCKDGKIWIKDSDLSKNIIRIVKLKD